MSADDSDIAAQLPEIIAEIKLYHRNAVWNAEEFVIFFRKTFGWILSRKRRALSGYKQDKMRKPVLRLAILVGNR